MIKTLARVGAAAALVVVLGGCTPQQWIQHSFGSRAPEAIRVARCESSLNPRAVSPGGGNHGLFQINNVHRANFTRVTGQPWSAVYNPHWNAVYAKRLFDQQGWRPWACKP
jgi:hypothetical protein